MILLDHTEQPAPANSPGTRFAVAPIGGFGVHWCSKIVDFPRRLAGAGCARIDIFRARIFMPDVVGRFRGLLRGCCAILSYGTAEACASRAFRHEQVPGKHFERRTAFFHCQAVGDSNSALLKERSCLG